VGRLRSPTRQRGGADATTPARARSRTCRRTGGRCVDLALERPCPPTVHVRPVAPVRRGPASRHRDRGGDGLGRPCARGGSRDLLRHGSGQREDGDDQDRRRVVGDAHEARLHRCDEGRDGRGGRRRRDDRSERRARARRAVRPARHPRSRRPERLRRSARSAAAARRGAVGRRCGADRERDSDAAARRRTGSLGGGRAARSAGGRRSARVCDDGDSAVHPRRRRSAVVVGRGHGRACRRRAEPRSGRAERRQGGGRPPRGNLGRDAGDRPASSSRDRRLQVVRHSGGGAAARQRSRPCTGWPAGARG
jgi:hypothetical protein